MLTDTEDGSRVGYRRPPKETRFKPGQSGNPKGRPRGTRKKAKLGNLEAAFTDPVTIKFRGKEITVPALEALCWQSVSEALAKADGKATREALKLANQLGLLEKARRELVAATNQSTRFTLDIFDELACSARVRERAAISDGAEEASPDLTQICAQKDDRNSL